MNSYIRNLKGMNIVGQGGKIILFMLPSLLLAVVVHIYLPHVAELPVRSWILKPAGYVLLLFGFVLWSTAIVQLLEGFPKGVLVTTGAYGVVRNPIYSSVACFILPGIALVTGTWVYFVVSAFLFCGVSIFIRKEEDSLLLAFGAQYKEYLNSVDRIIPFRIRRGGGND